MYGETRAQVPQPFGKFSHITQSPPSIQWRYSHVGSSSDSVPPSSRICSADRANAVHYGKYIGLGMGCVLVGLSVLIPTRLQEWVMQSADISLKY